MVLSPPPALTLLRASKVLLQDQLHDHLQHRRSSEVNPTARRGRLSADSMEATGSPAPPRRWRREAMFTVQMFSLSYFVVSHVKGSWLLLGLSHVCLFDPPCLIDQQ